MAAGKLSQHDALMIEVLRANGIGDAELLEAMKQGDVTPFREIAKGDFDFAELASFAQANWDEFEQAVREGYQIKFNTINGIKYLLKVKFQLHIDRDYVNGGDHLAQIPLKNGQIAWLRSVLSPFWAIVEQGENANGDGKLVKLELTNRS